MHIKPVRRGALTYTSLTRRPGGLQAHKIIIPPVPAPAVPELQTHEGYEWPYVLNGTLRLLLGEQDLVLHPGEVAEFDTHVPHRLGASGDTPVEILALFGNRANVLTSAPASPEAARSAITVRVARSYPWTPGSAAGLMKAVECACSALHRTSGRRFSAGSGIQVPAPPGTLEGVRAGAVGPWSAWADAAGAAGFALLALTDRVVSGSRRGRPWPR